LRPSTIAKNLLQFKLAQVFTEAEVTHWFLRKPTTVGSSSGFLKTHSIPCGNGSKRVVPCEMNELLSAQFLTAKSGTFRHYPLWVFIS
jgi:hypothetical protein